MPLLSSLTFSSSKFSLTVLSKECARTVDVVVPSPASFTVLLAASLIKVAPIFSTGCNKTTLSATVTPSFVITGFPRASSYITHFPDAPNVLFTAFDSFSTPCIICCLASVPNVRVLTISLGLLNSIKLNFKLFTLFQKSLQL